MLNKIFIMGRFTKDAELRSTQSGKMVASFTLAVDRDFKGQNSEKETDFINCVAWGNTAEFVTNYFSKGSMAIVEGRLQIRPYETTEGKRTATEVVVSNLYFGEGKKGAEAKISATTDIPAKEFGDDSDLPF